MTLADARRTLEQYLHTLPVPEAGTIVRLAGTEGDMRQALKSAIDALDHLQPLLARVADLESQLARARQDAVTAGVDALRRTEERLEEYRVREGNVRMARFDLAHELETMPHESAQAVTLAWAIARLDLALNGPVKR